MTVLITGACGFVGTAIATALRELSPTVQLCGIDNFIRPGSERNREHLRSLGARVLHGDIRCASDFESLPSIDWVIDAAANPSVLAGVDGNSSSRQLVEHNLVGTINVLELCKKHGAGLVLLSTSRVYSIARLATLEVSVRGNAYHCDSENAEVSGAGVTEGFSTAPPVSLYGATKLASETLALEYGEAFHLPVYVNRCGVLAGAGQFGRADQGIFAFWINAFLRDAPLKYIGFTGNGHQTRDCLHPRDVARLVWQQMNSTKPPAERVQNVSGGANSARSLAQLTDWCSARFGKERTITADPTPRLFDVPWLVLDSARAKEQWNWEPQIAVEEILEEIAGHAEQHPEWLDISAAL